MTGRRAFSVAIFVRHQGKVLLIKHKRLGTWLPVGGEIHDGETPLEAAQREMFEETGLRGTFTQLGGVDGTPEGLLAYEEHPAGSKGLHLNFGFVADVETDKVTPNDEFSEHQWVRTAAGVQCPRNVAQLVDLALHGGELNALARRWMDRFNAHDLEGLLALYDEEAVHTSPKLRAREPATQGRVSGKAALRAWFSDAMTRLPKLHYRELHLTAQGNRVFMEYLRSNPGEEDLVVAEVLVVNGGGRIAQSFVFHG